MPARTKTKPHKAATKRTGPKGRSKARRVTIFRDDQGEYRYAVQSWNWRTIDASEEGFKRKSTVERRVADRWPGVEVRDDTTV